LIRDGYAPGQAPVGETPKLRKSEALLREEGKWETVRRASKRHSPGRLFRPRLDLSYLSREAGSLTRGTPPLNYALVVSFKAAPDVSMYDSVRGQYPLLVPLGVPIGVGVPGSAP